MTKKLLLTILQLQLLAPALFAAVPIRWTVETSRVQPAQFEAYHGETIEFEATVNTYGKPLEAAFNPAFYWQTNGMGSAYWTAPATLSNNVMIARWEPAMDVGANVYSCFIGCPGEIYRAAFQLRLRPSPGAVPAELPLPVKTLDFAQVTVLNAPYYSKSETDAKIIELAPAPGNYAIVSNLAMTAVQPAAISDMATKSDLAGKIDVEYSPYESSTNRFEWTEAGFKVTAGRWGHLNYHDEEGVHIQFEDTFLTLLPRDVEQIVWSYPRGNKGGSLSLPSTDGVLATTSDIPTDSTISGWGYIKSYSESDPTVASAIGTHNSSSSAHGDIRTALAGKQPTISDLATIRSGAAAGATAVQPTAISDMETRTRAAATYQPKGSYLTTESDPTVASAIGTHNSSSSAHSDLRNALSVAQSGITIAADNALTAMQMAAEAQDTAAAKYAKPSAGIPKTDLAATVQTSLGLADSALQSFTESDPTVSSWAKASTKPSYTWTEIGSKPTIPTDSTVSGWGYLKSESDPTVDTKLAPIETTVNAWQTYWDGDDVRVTVTNYYGSADLPRLFLEQKISEGGTNYFKKIWSETSRLDVITNRIAELEAGVATKADRAWGFYDSHSGAWAPGGFTSISSESILISKDMSYQKTVTSAGEVWVLTATDPTVITGTETNGFLRITDSDGNSVFEIVKGDKRTVPATCSAVTAGNNSLTITYNVVAAEHPAIEICDGLEEQHWIAEGEPGCPATVAWSGASGAWVATVTGVRTMPKMFVKGTYEVGGETYARHGVPLGFEKVVIGGVYYRVDVETVNGRKLMVLTEL